MKQTTAMAQIALSVSLIALCAWIQIPFVIPFTMQTFAILTVSALLRTRDSLIALLVYLLLGLIGIPVFSGFSSGVGVLFSPTGGFLIGFFGTVLLTSTLIHRFGRSTPALVLSMATGLLVCYLFGTLWYCFCYASGTTLTAALTLCVLPFLIPDGCKIALAILVVQRVYPRLLAIESRHCR